MNKKTVATPLKVTLIPSARRLEQICTRERSLYHKTLLTSMVNRHIKSGYGYAASLNMTAIGLALNSIGTHIGIESSLSSNHEYITYSRCSKHSGFTRLCSQMGTPMVSRENLLRHILEKDVVPRELDSPQSSLFMYKFREEKEAVAVWGILWASSIMQQTAKDVWSYAKGLLIGDDSIVQGIDLTGGEMVTFAALSLVAAAAWRGLVKNGVAYITGRRGSDWFFWSDRFSLSNSPLERWIADRYDLKVLAHTGSPEKARKPVEQGILDAISEMARRESL